MSDAEAFRQFERVGFNSAAGGYRRFFAAVTGYAILPLLDAAGVGPHSQVLDVATGPGDAAFEAVRRGASVIAVDLAERMVQVATVQYPGIHFCVADAEQLPVRNHAMDAVVCNFGIGHFPNPDRAVTEIARILSPGGMVALSWWDQPDHHRVNGVFFEAVARAGAAIPPGLPPGPPVFRFSDDSELSAILQNVGLLDVSVEAHSTLHVLAGADELWEGILSATVRTAAVVNLQTEAVRRLIRFHFDELVRQYIVGKPQRLHIPVAFKIVRGKKP